MAYATFILPENAELLPKEKTAEHTPAVAGMRRGQVVTSRTLDPSGKTARRRRDEPGAPADEAGPIGRRFNDGQDTVAVGSERRLLRALRKGDERAFTRLVQAYGDRVYGVCLRMLGRHDEAEDTAQDVFISLHRGISSFRGESRLSTWIYRVTRNHCLNRLTYLERRQEKMRAPFEPGRLEIESSVFVRKSTRPDELLEGKELQALLEQAIRELPDEQRLLVILRDIQGLSYDELMEVCELPLGTVKSRLHRARLTLTSILNKWREASEPAPPSVDGDDE